MPAPHLIITPGEPAGIGPDIVLSALQQDWQANLLIIADPLLLCQRAAALNLAIEVRCINVGEEIPAHQAGVAHVLPVELSATVQAGQLNIDNVGYVLQTLRLASQLCLAGQADGIVTAPVQKSILNAAGQQFSGHTEFFAAHAGVEQTVMLFVVADKMKVALVTTHLPLKEVSAAITDAQISRVANIVQHDLQTVFGILNPRILVCGLNPHAGEGGYLGREEIEVIAPALAKLRESGMHISAPLPADTIFTPKYLAEADVILAMYHDQALPLVKYAGFGQAVNVTLGLPYLRTSVDHGTALDLAGTGRADAGSLQAALDLAIQLARRRSL